MAALLPGVLLGLLVGSVPCAWLLVRWRTGRDVAREGSGNVGALNASRVGRSKALGAVVLLLDILKGAAAVLVARTASSAPHADLAALVGAVAGHDYNPWLSLARRRLVGGKGFAAAAGGMLVALPWLVAGWCALVVPLYLGLRRLAGLTDEAPATAGATLLLPLLAWPLYALPGVLTTGALALLILPRHVPDVRALRAARQVVPQGLHPPRGG